MDEATVGRNVTLTTLSEADQELWEKYLKSLPPEELAEWLPRSVKVSGGIKVSGKDIKINGMYHMHTASNLAAHYGDWKHEQTGGVLRLHFHDGGKEDIDGNLYDFRPVGEQLEALGVPKKLVKKYYELRDTYFNPKNLKYELGLKEFEGEVPTYIDDYNKPEFGEFAVKLSYFAKEVEKAGYKEAAKVLKTAKQRLTDLRGFNRAIWNLDDVAGICEEIVLKY